MHGFSNKEVVDLARDMTSEVLLKLNGRLDIGPNNWHRRKLVNYIRWDETKLICSPPDETGRLTVYGVRVELLDCPRRIVRGVEVYSCWQMIGTAACVTGWDDLSVYVRRSLARWMSLKLISMK